MNGIPVLVALVGVLAAVAFFLSARAAKASLAAVRADVERLRAELAQAQKTVTEARAEAKERREEAAQLRADLERSKKRAFEQQEASKKLGGAQGIREELDKVAARLAEARAEAEHQAARAKAAEKDLDAARAQLERAKAKAAEAVPAAAAAPAPAAPAPAPAADDGKLAAEKDRADRAEAKLADTRKKLLEVEKDLKVARGRIETEKRVFFVQKGELELAQDRYTELKRRYDGLRKDHEELVDAVRQAAREERQLAEAKAKDAAPPAAAGGEQEPA